MDLTKISKRLLEQLENIQSEIAKHLSPENRATILGPSLEALVSKGSGKTAASAALYSDALRLAMMTVMSDGDVNDEEIEAILPLVLSVADKFKLLGKKYECLKAPIDTENTAQALAFVASFLSEFVSDPKVFGYRCEDTIRSSLGIVANIESLTGDAQPKHLLHSIFFETAKAIVALDGITSREEEFLEDLRITLAISDESQSAQVESSNENSGIQESLHLTAERARWHLQEKSSDFTKYVSLDDAAAESLSKHKGSLRLNGLTNLTDAAAESLSRHDGDLYLWGLTSLSDAAAESLSRHKGDLNLDRLTHLSDAAAESFSKHEHSLCLEGLTSISDAAAESLSKHKEVLLLDGLTSLSDAAAESLSKHKGLLCLRGLTSLSDAAADSLSKHQGSVQFECLNEVSLLATARLSKVIDTESSDFGLMKDYIPEDLMKGYDWIREGRWINKDEEIELFSELALDTATLLAVNYRFLNLIGVTSLSDEAAEALSKHEGSMNLSNLRVISEIGARHLAKHFGPLLLNLTLLPAEIQSILSPTQVPDTGEKQTFPEFSESDEDEEDDWDEEEEEDDDDDDDDDDWDEDDDDDGCDDNEDDEEGDGEVEQAEYVDDISRPTYEDVSGTITNSIGMKFVLIPAGTFLMGSREEEDGREEDDNQHEVTLTNEFYLGVMLVTQEQYAKVMGANPSWFLGDLVSGRDSSEFPVEQVSWYDAVEFCKRLSGLPEEKAAGCVYRLPTEAEWEYACRASSETKYGFGDDPDLLGEYAWYVENGGERTHPVALKKPNTWGLYDMHGNVWEWCNDWYGDYPRGSVTGPAGPIEGRARVYRGGCWCDEAANCRSAYRHGDGPDYRGSIVGFRVALSPSGIPK